MRRRLPFFIACQFGFASLAYAGAWTQKQGDLQFITNASIYSAHSYFDVQGKRRNQVPFYKQEISAYGEYGYTDDLTLGMQTAVARAHQSSNALSNSNWNLTDSEFFARKRVWQNNDSVISLQPSLLLPSPFAESGIKLGSDHPATGLRIAYGTNFSLFGRSHYADVSGGYYYRFGPQNDQFKLDVTAGFNITDSWQVIPQAFITKSAKKIKSATFTQSSADDYDATKLQISVQYALSQKSAVQLGAFITPLGRNTGAGKGVLLGYVRNF